MRKYVKRVGQTCLLKHIWTNRPTDTPDKNTLSVKVNVPNLAAFVVSVRGKLISSPSSVINRYSNTTNHN